MTSYLTTLTADIIMSDTEESHPLENAPLDNQVESRVVTSPPDDLRLRDELAAAFPVEVIRTNDEIDIRYISNFEQPLQFHDQKLDDSIGCSPLSSLESTVADTSGGSNNTTPDKERELSLKRRKRKRSSEEFTETVATSIDESHSEGKPASKRLSPEYTQRCEEEKSFDPSRSRNVPNKCDTDCSHCYLTHPSTLNCSCISVDSPPPTTK